MRAYNADISATRDPPLCWAQWRNNDVSEQGHLDARNATVVPTLCRHIVIWVYLRHACQHGIIKLRFHFANVPCRHFSDTACSTSCRQRADITSTARAGIEKYFRNFNVWQHHDGTTLAFVTSTRVPKMLGTWCYRGNCGHTTFCFHSIDKICSYNKTADWHKKSSKTDRT